MRVLWALPGLGALQYYSNMKPRRQRPKPIDLRMQGYEVVEKVAKPCATSARVLVPRHWIGKRVRAVRVDP